METDDFLAEVVEQMNKQEQTATASAKSHADSSCSIIRKVIMTRTEINIYPDGRVYPGKTQTWLQGGVEPPRRKKVELPKAKKIEGVVEL